MSRVVESLRSVDQWCQLSSEEIEGAAHELMECVGQDFEWAGVSTHSADLCIASVRHQQSQVVFRFVPGGRDLLGLSDSEYEAIKDLPNADDKLLNALRPAEEIGISPFLMSNTPLLEETVRQVIEIDRSLYRPDFQPLSGDKTVRVPIYLTRAEVNAALSAFGFSLPTESQWEYAVRGNTDTPFYFGAEIPRDQELDLIFDTDFRTTTAQAENAFGVSGMLFGGWCKDSIRSNRWHGTDLGPPHVVRGGGAIYWPWQNTGEWMLALSAMRWSSAELEDGTCSAHAVAAVNI